MRFAVHTRLEMSPFEIYPCRKRIFELTKIVKDIESYLSDWKTLNFSIPPKQVAVYEAQIEKGELKDHIIMAKQRKIACCSSHKSPKELGKTDYRNLSITLYLFRKEKSEKIVGREV